MDSYQNEEGKSINTEIKLKNGLTGMVLEVHVKVLLTFTTLVCKKNTMTEIPFTDQKVLIHTTINTPKVFTEITQLLQ